MNIVVNVYSRITIYRFQTCDIFYINFALLKVLVWKKKLMSSLKGLDHRWN